VQGLASLSVVARGGGVSCVPFRALAPVPLDAALGEQGL